MTDATLKAKVTADIAQFTSGMQDMRDAIDRMSGGAVSSGARLIGAFAAVAAAAIAVTAAAGRQAEELSQLSAMTGIGTETLQRYEVLLGRTGLTAQDLTVMMRTLSQNLEQARVGTGQSADRFRQLGIDIRTVTDTDDLIRRVATSVSHFANGTEKAAIVADLLGRGGLKFIPAFEGGAAAIDRAAGASARLGAELSAIQLDVLGRVDDQFDDLSLASKRFNQQLGALLAPSVDLLVSGLTHLLSVGSKVFQSLDTAADTLAIRFTHVGLALKEIGGTLFSIDALSAGAWQKTLTNLKLIDAEAVKLIARRRELAELGSPADTRAKPPQLADSGKLAEQAQAQADAVLKFSQSLFANQAALAQANLQNFQAHLDAKKRLSVASEVEIAQQGAQAVDDLSAFTTDSLQRQISNYAKFYQQKSALFATDTAGQAAKQKFELESSQQIASLLNQLEVAQVKSDTARVQSSLRTAEAIRQSQAQVLDDAVEKMKVLDEAQQALFKSESGLIGAATAVRQQRFALIDAEAARQRLAINQNIADEERRAQALLNLDTQVDTRRRQTVQQFPTFFEQQMGAIVASNTFSMGQMVSTWSSGIANMIVHGGNLKAVWEQTQVALVQAALNAGVQQLALLALRTAQELGIVTAGETAKTVATTTGAAARTAITQTEATAQVGIMTGANTAILAMFGSVAAALKTLFVSVLVPAVIATGKFIMGVLSSIAAAMKATIFGIPVGVAILAGIIAIGIALAATGNIPGLAEGGIVMRPTLALIGEGGPEAVVPLSRGRGVGIGAGGGITIVVTGNTLLGDDAAMAKKLAAIILKASPGVLRRQAVGT